MIWDDLRRIVTEENANGRSSVMLDGGPAKLLNVDEGGLAEIWSASIGATLLDGVDRLADEDVRLEPSPGAIKIRWFTVPAEKESASASEREAEAAFAFAACAATHARVDTARHAMMHETKTLDAIILVRGSVDLLLDDGEARSLKPGDVVIQRSTNHAWVNTGNETALLVAVLVKSPAAQDGDEAP